MPGKIVAWPDLRQSFDGDNFQPSSHVGRVALWQKTDGMPLNSGQNPLRLPAVAKTPSHSTISSDQGIGWFMPLVVLILLLGIGSIAFLATQRETNIGVQPEAGEDHWHNAFGVYNCDQFLPTIDIELAGGIHTHGQGLIHIHPFNPAESGRDATLGVYLEATEATLTDSKYEPGPFEQPVTLDESVGCGSEPSELVLAYWSDVNDTEAEPEFIREDLNDFRFVDDFGAITLALIPEGTEPADVPRPPAWQRLLVVDDSLTGGNEIPVPELGTTVPADTTPTTEATE